jgi:dihydroorotase
MRIVINNGRLIDPTNGIDERLNLYITDGRIAALGQPPAGFKADRVIDAKNLIVAPGLVELSAYLREPGAEHKATIASEARAALKSGITTLCCPPDTDPIIDTPAVVELINHRAAMARASRIVCLGALTRGLGGEQLSEMFALKHIGCMGVSNGDRPVANAQVMRRAMEYAATCGLTVFIRAQDPWLAASGCAHEGEISTRLGLPGIPETAETVAVSRDLLLIEQTGVRAHFCRLSCARSVQLIQAARERGLQVSADVSINHLLFTEHDLLGFDGNYHVLPPFRTARDRDALREAVAAGTVEAVCADHQPHELGAKEAPFGATEAGIAGLETLLPAALALVEAGVFDLPRAIDALSTQPARILGLNAGSLSIGSPADVCIIDPNAVWTYPDQASLSAGRNSPYRGDQLTGRAVLTLLNGVPSDTQELEWV